MTYADGFMAAVPISNQQEYIDHATRAAAVFKRHGALKVVENWGDDVPEGKNNSMHSAVLRKDDEAVVLSWVLWPSKEIRDAAWEKIMGDPAMEQEMGNMPFDGSRLIYGGFKTILDE